eukprot:GGOE01008316.1.p5 GENE.GGOE01008316.1~~GGOE01008316.1.p5  ORF type:complete len:125 (-),score=0.92 GGOE01008316.1:520-894(-)
MVQSFAPGAELSHGVQTGPYGAEARPWYCNGAETHTWCGGRSTTRSVPSWILPPSPEPIHCCGTARYSLTRFIAVRFHMRGAPRMRDGAGAAAGASARHPATVRRPRARLSYGVGGKRAFLVLL